MASATMPRATMPPDYENGSGSREALLVLLPLLVVLSTFFFLLLLFLVSLVILRRRRGIALGDRSGPVDMSREDLVQGEGGFEGVEGRWLESVSENARRGYLRAKEYQAQHAPNSAATDITLSQFLSIQEKGVSAWSFEPDYEMIGSLLVHARTELTFLPDPASATSVQSNLPLPKLNEVYYWEVKMFDLPPTTNVAVGLSTKPFPLFRLPGHARYSVAYHSNGDKAHNYPFAHASYSSALKEGDVLGVGYRPRSGTVFFTRNGRKLDDAFVGLAAWNLFPTIGADGPCSLHVNLGQAGFVFIEANVKKWGLAPSVGTLAPPPAYGSERGSILLDAGANTPSSTPARRLRRPAATTRHASPPPPLTPLPDEDESAPVPAPAPGPSARYVSPTDAPFHAAPNAHIPRSPPSGATPNPFVPPRAHRRAGSASTPAPPPAQSAPADQELSPVHRAAPLPLAPPDSPLSPGHNPPTPNPVDIRLHAFARARFDENEEDEEEEAAPRMGRRERQESTETRPPAYSPLDANTYADGVTLDLPADIIGAALERGVIPGDMLPAPRSSTGGSGSGSGRRRSGRRAGGRRSRDT